MSVGKLSLPKKDKVKSRTSGGFGDTTTQAKQEAADKELEENLMVTLQV